MTTVQVVETSVTVNNNSSIQDYVHPDDQTQPTFIILITKCQIHLTWLFYLKLETNPYSFIKHY